MSESIMIVEGVNCPKTRWIYRGIAILASVVWLTRFAIELLWPSLCSSWSSWTEESVVVVLFSAAPILYSVCMVRAFYVPDPDPTTHNSGDRSPSVGIKIVAILASVVWLARFAVEILWPSLCSSWSSWKEEWVVVVLFTAAPFLYFACMVVRSFYVPVPVPTTHNSGDLSPLVGIQMVAMFVMSHYSHTIELCIYGFSFVVGLSAVMQLSWPPIDVRVQQVVYADFVLCLVAYLGYQRPFWIACVFVAALILVNTLLFQGILRLDHHLKPSSLEGGQDSSRLVSDLNV